MDDDVEQDPIRRWVSGYERAWTTNDPDDIRALFTDDAEYYTAPFREPWRGAEGIVAGWLGRRDGPDDHRFTWRVQDSVGSRHYVRGETEYLGDEPARFANLWVVELAGDGRARSFTEWWMDEPMTT